MDNYLIELCEKNTTENDIRGKYVIEVGSNNINGSFRSVIQKHFPREYFGVDIVAGDGVDEICNIHNLTKRFGYKSFDIVVCTEVIEHIKDWRNAINQLKSILKIDGILYLTSRSKGFGKHDFPNDYWRYEIEDIEKIFSNWEIKVLEKDQFRYDHFGFFLKAIKKDLGLINLNDIALYSIDTDPRHNPKDSKLKRVLNLE